MTYRHSLISAPTNLDPAQASNPYAGQIANNLFQTLYRYKYLARPYELTPELASDMPAISDGGLTVEISLRTDARFGDSAHFADGKGRSVNAGDVAYSILRHFDPIMVGHGAWLWRDALVGVREWAESGADYDTLPGGIEVISDRAIRFRLTDPYPQFTHTLANAMASVVPREVVEAIGPEFGVRPVGSGPYVLTHFDPTVAQLERNPNYMPSHFDLAGEGYDPQLHGRLGIGALGGAALPIVERIEVSFLAEGSSRWFAFRQREIDFVTIPSELIEQVTDAAGRLTASGLEASRSSRVLEPGLVYLLFDMDDPQLGANSHHGADLRCAIRQAFDWEARNRLVHGGQGVAFPGIIPPILAEHDAALSRDSISHQPDRARQTIASLAADGGLPELRYSAVARTASRQFFELLRSLLVDVGYPADRIRYQPYPSWGDYIRAINAGEVQIMDASWTLDFPDAQNIMQLFYGPNERPGPNMGNYRNPEYDRLFESASSMPASAARTDIYRAANQLVTDDCAAIAGLARTSVYAWHDNILGLPEPDVVGGVSWRFVSKAEVP